MDRASASVLGWSRNSCNANAGATNLPSLSSAAHWKEGVANVASIVDVVATFETRRLCPSMRKLLWNQAVLTDSVIRPRRASSSVLSPAKHIARTSHGVSRVDEPLGCFSSCWQVSAACIADPLNGSRMTATSRGPSSFDRGPMHPVTAIRYIFSYTPGKNNASLLAELRWLFGRKLSDGTTMSRSAAAGRSVMLPVTRLDLANA